MKTQCGLPRLALPIAAAAISLSLSEMSVADDNVDLQVALGEIEGGVAVQTAFTESAPFTYPKSQNSPSIVPTVELPEMLLSLEPAEAIGIESIIPPDERKPVSHTNRWPFSGVVLITSSLGRCSGFLYGENIVATSGHCLYHVKSKKWATDVFVFPGRNGSSVPFGFCKGTRLVVAHEYISASAESADYGAIRLNCKVGSKTDFFPIRAVSVSVGNSCTVAGYPGDKPLTQWEGGGLVRAVSSSQIFYDSDTFKGNSGGPLWVYIPSESETLVAGMHSNGLHGSGDHKKYNHAVAMTATVAGRLLAWKRRL